jgi:hypothetical protein
MLAYFQKPFCLWCDNFGERKAKFDLGTSRTTQM